MCYDGRGKPTCFVTLQPFAPQLKNDYSRLHLAQGLMAWVMSMKEPKNIFVPKKLDLRSEVYIHDPSLRPVVAASYTVLALVSMIEVSQEKSQALSFFKDATSIMANSINMVRASFRLYLFHL